jgi:tripartite-type tricarboxylate transporter receptor subunit TctC
MKSTRLLACAGVIALSHFLLPDADAQAYPNRPIRIVVGSTPGSSGDAIARLTAKLVPQTLRQTMVVENRAGASGGIAAELVAKAPADGYTLLMLTNTTVIAKVMRPRIPFDLEKDFAPVALISDVPLVMVAHPSVPAADVKSLIALAKAQPGKLSYASAGVASATHVAGELLKLIAEVDVLHVPFKGAAEAATGVLSGETNLAITGIVSMIPLIQSGRLRPLAVTSAKRSALLPNVPTLAEAGVRDYAFGSWVGMLAPAAVPKEILEQLNAAIVKAVQSSEMKEVLDKQGMEPAPMGTAQFGAYLRSEIAQTAKIVKFANIKDE